MSKTLNFTTSLQQRARRLHRLGQTAVALKLWQQLASQPDLSLNDRFACQYQPAVALMRLRHFRQAGPYLAQAARLRPDHPRCQYLLAVCLGHDGRTSLPTVRRHFRHALKLGGKPAWWAAYGHCLRRHGQTTASLAALRRAVELAPHDVRWLGRLTKALEAAGKNSEATRLLNVARFRFRGDAAFLALAARQRFHGATRRQEQPALTVLPFLRLTGGDVPAGRVLRRDHASTARPHVLRRRFKDSAK